MYNSDINRFDSINSGLGKLLDKPMPAEPVALNKFATLTLKPSYYPLKPQIQFSSSSDLITKYCKKRGIKYWLIAETTKNLNIHYHGLMEFKDEKQYRLFRRWYSNKLGHLKIDSFINFKAVTDYCRKELSFTQQFIQRPWIINQE